uniref:ABC transporter ATP-binding protein n=1 Tax=Thermofilum pendens TaxID=2269 RepID=A0A7C4B9X8_THEPE
MLLVENLSVGYGKMEVVHGVSFSLSRGRVLAIVGPNGSGKSTLLKGIFGTASVLGGRVLYDGVDVTKAPPHIKVSLGMAYLPQVKGVFEELTVRENLELALMSLPKDEGWERVEEVLELFPELKGLEDRRARTLSGGERQMLAIAMSMVKRPKLLMLDEPTAALAPKVASALTKKILELRGSYNLAVILVEQNARLALKISDEALLMVSGEVKYLGSSEELLSNSNLAKVYLGLSRVG